MLALFAAAVSIMIRMLGLVVLGNAVPRNRSMSSARTVCETLARSKAISVRKLAMGRRMFMLLGCMFIMVSNLSVPAG